MNDKTADVWNEYDFVSAPINYVSKGLVGGEFHSPYRAILYKDKLQKIVGKDFRPIPHDLAISTMEEVARDFGFENHQTEYTKRGDGVYMSYLSDKQQEAVEVGDIVQYGFMARNYHSQLGFRLGFFSYRLECGNGATSQEVMGEKVLTTIGKDRISELKTDITQFMKDMQPRIHEIVDMHRNFAKYKVEEQDVQELIKIPMKLPFLEIDKVTHNPFLKEMDMNYWDAFNIITAKVWHGRGGINTRSSVTSEAERVIMAIITNKPKATATARQIA